MAVYVAPDPERDERAPPPTSMSSSPKVIDGSLSANVITAVWPARSVATSLVTTIVGAVRSIVVLSWAAGAVCGLPASSVWVAVIVSGPSPRLATSASVRTIGWAVPVPVRLRTMLPVEPVSVTTTVAPLSAVTVTMPPVCVASASVAPSLTPTANSSVGAAGGVASSVNVTATVAAACGFPATSVWEAVTLTSPSPSVPRSTASKTTACAEPVPITFLETGPSFPVKTTAIAAPSSPVTVTTPAVWTASAAETGSVTPGPSTSATGCGADASSVNWSDAGG
jgi:hypothetical protein